MYKLSGQSLTRGTWFLPETQPMITQERDSTSTITLGPEAPEIAFDDWLLDDDWQEGDYVWRVKNITDDTNTDTRTVELEHIVKTLDDITLGEVTVETIAGAGATTCTAKQAVQYILSQHDAWTLGDFEYDVSNPYEFDGETLLDALETVTDTLEYAVWEYNLSTFPFKLHVRQRDNTVRCEMRGERNLNTLKRSISRSGMYTRIYPTGKNGLQLDSGYLSKNENLYGRVDHRETDQSKSTKDNLRAWAQGRLNRHCEPRVTIQISGLELSQETGEPLDILTMNKVCQCPLPEYSTTITERIVKKQWRDRRKEPENVNVTLANNVTDITTIVKEQVRGGSGGRAGAGQAKQNYLFEANGEHLLYEVFDECGHVHGLLRMTSESLRIAFENLNDSTRSEFMLTAESLRIQFENEINSTRSQFEMTSESLRIEFQNTASSLRSEFQMSAQSLRVEFQNTASSLRSEFQLTAQSLRIEFNNEASSLRSAIQAEAGRINLVVEGTGSSATVKRAAIILAINNGTSSAHIDADEVYIGNQKSSTVINGKCSLSDVTADVIKTKIADIASLTTQAVSGTTLSFNSVSAGSISFRSSAGSGYAYSNIKDVFVSSVELSGPVNGVYTLSTYNANAQKTVVGTFSRATSLSGAWSGGTYHVVASPQGEELYTTIGKKGETWNGNICTVSIGYENPISGQWIATGCTAEVDATDIYDAGFADGEAQFTRQTITLQGSQTSDLTLQGAAASTVQVTLQGSQTASLTLQGESQTVYEEVSSGGTVYYTAGTAATYYNAGTTTKYARGDSVTVTLQGSQTASLTLQGSSQTVFEEVSSGGTLYYTAGTAVTRYKGNGSSVTGRGDSVSVKPCGNAVRFKRHTSSETPTGTWYTINSTSYDLTYYVGGTDTTYYKGNGSSVTGRGDSESITPIGSTSKRLSSVTRYKAGTNVGKLYNAGEIATYYKGNGGSFTVQGTSVSVTPIGSTSKRLSSVTRYKAGTNVGKLYNAGEIATYYPATQTLYKAGTNIGKLYNAGTISTAYYTKS